MKDTMIVVFTQRIDATRIAYLQGLGLDSFSQEGCTAAAVTYPSGGHCIGQHTPEDADILLVADDEIDDNTRLFMKSYINSLSTIVVAYHKGASNNYRKSDDSEKHGHKDVIEELCEGKSLHTVEAHSNSGFVFDQLRQVRSAIEETQKRKYTRAVEKIEDFICGDIILEAKVDFLHKLLVPPSKDSGDWGEIKKDWSNLMGLVKDDSEKKEKYEQAWEEFKRQDPQQYSSDPFSERYYGSEDEEGILQNLRDELLS